MHKRFSLFHIRRCHRRGTHGTRHERILQEQGAGDGEACCPGDCRRGCPKAVPVQISVIGNVEPSSTIAVKAQVGGTLIKVHFTEGQDVKKATFFLR